MTIEKQLAGELGPLTSDMGLPCKICIEIERARRAVNSLEESFYALPHVKNVYDNYKKKGHQKLETCLEELKENTAEGKRLLKSESALRELRASHPKCPGCGLLFGGEHLVSPMKSGVCYYCDREEPERKLKRETKGPADEEEAEEL